MKKMLSIIVVVALALSLAIGLAACGAKDISADDAKDVLKTAIESMSKDSKITGELKMTTTAGEESDTNTGKITSGISGTGKDTVYYTEVEYKETVEVAEASEGEATTKEVVVKEIDFAGKAADGKYYVGSKVTVDGEVESSSRVEYSEADFIAYADELRKDGSQADDIMSEIDFDATEGIEFSGTKKGKEYEITVKIAETTDADSGITSSTTVTFKIKDGKIVDMNGKVTVKMTEGEGEDAVVMTMVTEISVSIEQGVTMTVPSDYADYTLEEGDNA